MAIPLCTGIVEVLAEEWYNQAPAEVLTPRSLVEFSPRPLENDLETLGSCKWSTINGAFVNFSECKFAVGRAAKKLHCSVYDPAFENSTEEQSLLLGAFEVHVYVS